MIALHLFQVFWLGFSLDTPSGVSGPTAKKYPKLSYVLTWSLFKRVRFFAESVKCDNDTVVIQGYIFAQTSS